MLALVSVDLSELLIRKIEDYRTQHSKKKAQRVIFLYLYKHHYCDE